MGAKLDSMLAVPTLVVDPSTSLLCNFLTEGPELNLSEPQVSVHTSHSLGYCVRERSGWASSAPSSAWCGTSSDKVKP